MIYFINKPHFRFILSLPMPYNKALQYIFIQHEDDNANVRNKLISIAAYIEI